MRAVPSRKASDWRTASSSSITCTRLADCIAEILVGYARHGEAEHRATASIRLHGDQAAMGFHDRARNGKPHPHAVTLGRDERLEQLSGNLRRNAGTAVGDADFQ